jgi:hypothetical protein
MSRALALLLEDGVGGLVDAEAEEEEEEEEELVRGEDRRLRDA